MFVCVCVCVVEFGGSVDIPAITNFIDGGGNVLVAASSNIGKFHINYFMINYVKKLTCELMLYY